jgi:hypothetical protein
LAISLRKYILQLNNRRKKLNFWARGRCENLEEEYEYRFRVLAVNRGGRGQPGPPSAPVIAMHKNIPPALKVRSYSDLWGLVRKHYQAFKNIKNLVLKKEKLEILL